MRVLDKKTQLEILDKSYVTIDDIYNLLPIGKNYSAKIFREIEKELKEKDIPLFITRPRVIPIEYLLKRFPQLRKFRKENKNGKEIN